MKKLIPKQIENDREFDAYLEDYLCKHPNSCITGKLCIFYWLNPSEEFTFDDWAHHFHAEGSPWVVLNTNFRDSAVFAVEAQEILHRTRDEKMDLQPIKPIASIHISVCAGFLIVTFARPPEAEALKLLESVAKSHGFWTTKSGSDFTTMMNVTKLYDSKDVADYFKAQFENIEMPTLIELAPSYIPKAKQN